MLKKILDTKRKKLTVAAIFLFVIILIVIAILQIPTQMFFNRAIGKALDPNNFARVQIKEFFVSFSEEEGLAKYDESKPRATIKKDKNIVCQSGFGNVYYYLEQGNKKYIIHNLSVGNDEKWVKSDCDDLQSQPLEVDFSYLSGLKQHYFNTTDNKSFKVADEYSDELFIKLTKFNEIDNYVNREIVFTVENDILKSITVSYNVKTKETQKEQFVFNFFYDDIEVKLPKIDIDLTTG